MDSKVLWLKTVSEESESRYPQTVLEACLAGESHCTPACPCPLAGCSNTSTEINFRPLSCPCLRQPSYIDTGSPRLFLQPFKPFPLSHLTSRFLT